MTMFVQQGMLQLQFCFIIDMPKAAPSATGEGSTGRYNAFGGCLKNVDDNSETMSGAFAANACFYKLPGQCTVQEYGLPFMMGQCQSALDEFLGAQDDGIGRGHACGHFFLKE
jgi:hypothetical protein